MFPVAFRAKFTFASALVQLPPWLHPGKEVRWLFVFHSVLAVIHPLPLCMVAVGKVLEFWSKEYSGHAWVLKRDHGASLRSRLDKAYGDFEKLVGIFQSLLVRRFEVR